MTATISIAINGASGKMGRAITRLAAAHTDLRIVALLVGEDSTSLGRAPAERDGAASVPAYSRVLADDVSPQVLIDFSTPAGFDRALDSAMQRRIAFVSGTTGLDARQRAALDRAAVSIAVLWSANFSLGVALLSRLVAQAAQALPAWDCEIAEAHHSAKKDAPSGTALALGRAVAAARDQDFDGAAQLSRAGADAPRAHDSIGFAVTRAGDIVGEHTVMFATAGERIELVHRATDREIFARGALAAAGWIAGRAPGCYALADVIGAA